MIFVVILIKFVAMTYYVVHSMIPAATGFVAVRGIIAKMVFVPIVMAWFVGVAVVIPQSTVTLQPVVASVLSLAVRFVAMRERAV